MSDTKLESEKIGKNPWKPIFRIMFKLMSWVGPKDVPLKMRPLAFQIEPYGTPWGGQDVFRGRPQDEWVSYVFLIATVDRCLGAAYFIQNLRKHLRSVNYFHKKLQLRCLTGF